MLISIEGQTFAEIRDKVFELALAFGYDKTPSGDEIPVKIADEKVEETPVKKPLGRPKKVDAKPVETVVSKPVETAIQKQFEVVVETPVEPTPETPKEINKDTVFEALQLVSSKHGIPEARNLLLKFDAGRISELKASDYPAFVDACNKLYRSPKKAAQTQGMNA